MPRGFGRGWWGFGPGGGRGRGNPFPFCRNFPWLPRWWWATPHASSYAATIPYYGYPGYGTGYPSTPPPTGVPPTGYGYPGYGTGYPNTPPPTGIPPTG